MIIRFTPEADVELTGAREWYSRQRKNLDLEFMQCIDDALSRAVDNPYFFPIVYRNLRRAVVRRFPFAIFYKVGADEIQVVAVFHSRRDPEEWRLRVE
jgi:plasmid stabilization system protein ParE